MFEYWLFSVIFYLFIVAARELIFKESFNVKEEYILMGLTIGLIVQQHYTILSYVLLIIVPFAGSVLYQNLIQRNMVFVMALITGLFIVNPFVLGFGGLLFFGIMLVIKHFNQFSGMEKNQAIIMLVSIAVSLAVQIICVSFYKLGSLSYSFFA